MRSIHLACALILAMGLQGCDSSGLKASGPSNANNARPVSGTQVNVFEDYIAVAKLPPLAAATDDGNILSNGGFEAGPGSWANCAAGSINLSDDSLEGANALVLTGNSCAYQSVVAQAGSTYVLSCKVKLSATQAWTGMGLVFSNNEYVPLLESPSAQATSTEYTTLVSRGIAPEGTSFASIWVHSDHGALVDSCSLTLAEDHQAPSLPVGNMLSNGDFTDFTIDNTPKNWVTGCGGSAWANETGLSVTEGACVEQALTVNAVESLKYNDGSLGCQVSEISGYSDLSFFLDGKLQAVKKIEPYHINTFVSVDIKSTDSSNGFVTFYSEGVLRVNDCALLVKDKESIEPEAIDGSLNPVVFASADLENDIRAVNDLLSDPEVPITKNDMLSVISIGRKCTGTASCNYNPGSYVRDLVSLAGIEHAKNLQYFYPRYSKISDLEPLAGLTNLERIELEVAPDFSDLSPLSDLIALKELNITGGEISDLSTLTGLTLLENVDLASSVVSDLSPLVSLTNLKKLVLGPKTRITDVSALAELSTLEELNIGSSAPVTLDASHLAGLPLKWVYLSNVSLTNLQSLVAGTALPAGSTRVQSGTRQVNRRHLISFSAAGLDLSSGSEDVAALSALAERVLVVLNVSANNIDVSDNSDDLATLALLETQGILVNLIDDTPVVFSNAALESTVRARLNLATTEVPITKSQIQGLTGLTIDSIEVDSLVGLEHAINLENLVINDNSISDFDPIAGLRELSAFSNANSISNVIFVSNWQKLESLRLNLDGIFYDLSPFSSLSSLTSLTLTGDTQISDLSPLADSPSLLSIAIEDKSLIEDLSPLIGLPNLLTLKIGSGKISDISPIASMESLKAFFVRTTSDFSDLSPLAGTAIKEIAFYGGSSISDVSALRVPRITIESGHITDLTAVSSLASEYLNLVGNSLTNIQALVESASVESLQVFRLSEDKVDLSSGSAELAALHALNDLGVIIELVSSSGALIDLPSMQGN